jgi:hypothetical protein
MPWILMFVLTAVQVLGNVYSSYSYMMLHNPEHVKDFTDSVLFFLPDPDAKVNQVMVSYITGAILPIVSLCMTSMVVNAAGLESDDTYIKKDNENESKKEKDITELIDLQVPPLEPRIIY